MTNKTVAMATKASRHFISAGEFGSVKLNDLVRIVIQFISKIVTQSIAEADQQKALMIAFR